MQLSFNDISIIYFIFNTGLLLNIEKKNYFTEEYL